MELTLPLYETSPSTDFNYPLTYSFTNPNDPTHYQSFASTQKGSIDQSIFTLQYDRNDPYVFGNTITQFLNGGTTSRYKCVNRFAKVNSTVSPRPYTRKDFAYFYGNMTYNKYPEWAEYSPSGISYDPQDSRFFVNFPYGRACLGITVTANKYPFTSPSQAFYSMNDAIQYYGGLEGVYVEGATLTYKTAVTGTGHVSFFYLQFAGSLYDMTWSNSAWTQGNLISGVFSTPLPDIISSWCYYNGTSLYGTSCEYFDFDAIGGIFSAKEHGSWQFKMIPLASFKTIMDRLGFYWTMGDVNTVDIDNLGSRCTDPNVRCPIIDTDNGNMVTSTVLQGTEIADYAATHENCNYNWDYGAADYDGKSWAEVRAEYAQPTLPTIEETDEIDLIQPVISTAGGNTIWIMNQSRMNGVFDLIWGASGGTIPQQILDGLFMMGESPIDFIVSLRAYPLDLNALTNHQTHNLMFGRYDTGLSLDHVVGTNILILNLGTFYFNDGGLKHDFTDYEPYTRYYVYIPYCGVIQVSAIECINTTLTIKMIIDLTTGACTAVLFTNNVPYKYIDGMIGIEIPVTGRDMAGYASTVLSAAMGGGVGGGITATKAAKGLVSGHMSNAMQAQSIAGMSSASDAMLMEHYAGAEAFAAGSVPVGALGAAGFVAGAAIAGTTAALLNAPSVENTGSNTPATGLAKPNYPYFIVQRSEVWTPAYYAELYGRPLNEGGKVREFGGYSVFGNIKLDGITKATSSEKTLISELLTSGVYL